jgi:predicted unusual protein kinase regulating ubiquinone biosynthesis (AarF/ABC1/UbiB family)
VALLDFGLMAQMRTDHQEAMAHGVVNIIAENFEALEQAAAARAPAAPA